MIEDTEDTRTNELSSDDVIDAKELNEDESAIHGTDNSKLKQGKKSNHAGRDVIQNFTKIDNRIIEERKGLPSNFRSIYQKLNYELIQEKKECDTLLEDNNFIIITSADGDIRNAIANHFYEKNKDTACEIQELLFEEYDRNGIVNLVDDIKKGTFKYSDKLILFVMDSERYISKEDPQFLQAITTFNQGQTQNIQQKLEDVKCKIIYFSHFEGGRPFRFAHFNIPFLEPLLKCHEKLDWLAPIIKVKKESRLSKNSPKLLAKVRKALKKDDLNYIIDQKVKDSIDYIKLIDEHEIYQFVLFIAAFFRRLDFDEFEQLLFFLITEVEKKKKRNKLIEYWQKKADKILVITHLTYEDKNNLRLVDFSSNSNAEICTDSLLKSRRFFVDKLAKIIASEKCVLEMTFGQNTLNKVNLFIADFGITYGQYYCFETPLKLLAVIEGHRVEVFRARDSVNKLSKELNHLKENEDSSSLLLIQVRELLRTENNRYTKKRGYLFILFSRYSDLLVRLYVTTEIKDNVFALLEEFTDKISRYYSILDVLNVLHFKSEIDVFYWYYKLLLKSEKKTKILVYQNVLQIFQNDPDSFFYSYRSIIQWLPIEEKKKEDYSDIEKYSITILFHFFFFQTSGEEEQFSFEKLFNIDRKVSIEFLPLLITHFFHPDFEFLIEENTYGKDNPMNAKWVRQDRAKIFERLFVSFTKSEDIELRNLLVKAINDLLDNTTKIRLFRKALDENRSEYGMAIKNCSHYKLEDKIKEKRNQLIEFIKQIK